MIFRIRVAGLCVSETPMRPPQSTVWCRRAAVRSQAPVWPLPCTSRHKVRLLRCGAQIPGSTRCYRKAGYGHQPFHRIPNAVAAYDKFSCNIHGTFAWFGPNCTPVRMGRASPPDALRKTGAKTSRCAAAVRRTQCRILARESFPRAVPCDKARRG